MYHKVRICSIPIISLYTALIIVSGFYLSGCMSSNANANLTSSNPATTTPDTSNNTTPATTTAPMLAWDAPTTYTDGSAPLDLTVFRVYFSSSPNAYSAGSYYPVSAPSTSVKVKDIISLGTGTFYFCVTAMNNTGEESDPSNEVSRNVQ
jgi:hypothetical protein